MCFAKPSVVRRIGVPAHKRVVNRLVALKNLAVNVTLIVVPDIAPRFWEYGFDRQKVSHLLRLEDPALRIDQRDALVVKHEARLKLGRGQAIVDFAEPTDVPESGHAHESVTIEFIHATRPTSLSGTETTEQESERGKRATDAQIWFLSQPAATSWAARTRWTFYWTGCFPLLVQAAFLTAASALARF